MEEPKFVEVHYFKQVRNPSLKQYLVRRAITEAGVKTRDMKGITVNPETGRPMPQSALSISQEVKGLTAEKLLELHPEWQEEYEREYGKRRKTT
ncbi:unnamed protein product [marine sediment metagenome]|uniref:Uncharacterized protein n=1 Tax=marine sediment metagenome TaxID=412755 RepID=X1LIV9_9ZZZZ